MIEREQIVVGRSITRCRKRCGWRTGVATTSGRLLGQPIGVEGVVGDMLTWEAAQEQ
jgi:hypothetical protein